jgi:hypothetical protein
MLRTVSAGGFRMTRHGVLGVLLLSGALVACGGGKQRPAHDANARPIVLFERDAGEQAREMPAVFALLSRKHGCKVDYKTDLAISDCRDEGVIGLGRKGTYVIVMCEGWMSPMQCKNLFTAIAEERNR